MASYLDFAMMCHSYNFISIRRFINMCPLPLFCFNDSRKCELKIVEETQKTQIETKITRKKYSILKHNTTFLNLLVNIEFAILATFQILV